MKPALAYLRVSTTGQRDEKTIEAQRHELNKFAQTNGYTIIKEFVDEAVSGATEIGGRVGLPALLNALQDGVVKDVLVYDMGRIARDVLIGLQAEKAVRDLDARYIYVQAPSTGDEATDNLLKTTLLGIAEFERVQIMRRTRAGKIAKAKQGIFIVGNGVPYGYDYIDRKLVINPDEAKIVKKMFELYLEDNGSTLSIVRWLIDNKIPSKSGKGWEGNNNIVRRILRSETYTGIYWYNRTIRKKIKGKYKIFPRPKEEWVELKVPPIVDRGMFDIVQLKLDKNRTISPRTHSSFYIFTGLVKCGLCGKAYHARPSSRRKGITHTSYVCGTNNKTGLHCDNRSISESKLVDVVYGYVKTCLLDTNYFRKDIDAITNTTGSASEAARQKIERLKSQIAALEQKELVLLEERIIGRFRPELLESKLNEVSGTRLELVARLAEEEKNMAKLDKQMFSSDALYKMLRDIGENMIKEHGENPTPQDIRNILKRYITDVEIYPETILINGEINVPTVKLSW